MSTLFVTCKHPPLSICLFPKDSEAGAEEEEVEEEEEEEGGSGMGWKQTKGWVGGGWGGDFKAFADAQGVPACMAIDLTWRTQQVSKQRSCACIVHHGARELGPSGSRRYE